MHTFCIFQAADLKAPIDPRILSHINHLVDEGVYNVGELKRHVRLHVTYMFADNSLPNAINRRFYPSREDLRKLVYRQRQKIMHGLIDQEYLLEKINNWKKNKTDITWFFRPAVHVTEASGSDNEMDGNTSQSLLLVFQTSWQAHLLARYGTELVFLDATYRTTRYAIPLFFLCVHTNSGYCVVGTLVMEREDSKSLSEALNVLHQMNPTWSPKAFMIDSSEIEMNAIKEIFQGMKFFHALSSLHFQANKKITLY